MAGSDKRVVAVVHGVVVVVLGVVVVVRVEGRARGG